jgi:hypothetical protein
MKTQYLAEQEYEASPCATSPWTDCYQDAPSQRAERPAFKHGSSQRDDQRQANPVLHPDALSGIDNRYNR